MAVKLKQCKECGKMFTPKGRENFCSAKHYRPCPICGEPAEVLYFSDPPRRCDNCRGKKNLQPMTAADKAKLVSPATAQKEQPSNNEDNSIFQSRVREVDPVIQRLIDASYPAVDMEKDELIEFEHVWTYVGMPLKNGFIPGHTYSIKVTTDRAAYIVTSDEDLSANQSVNIYDRFSSRIMLNRNFVKSAPSK